LKFAGSVADLNDAGCFRRWLRDRYATRGIVYAKAPFGGPEQVFRYLGRYTHRVAITNSRLRSLDDGHVAFAWKDYADGHRNKVMRLTADEFLRRFLLHVLPKGFVRIRHFGLMAGGPGAAEKFARCRTLLEPAPPIESDLSPPRPTWRDRLTRDLAEPTWCPRCQGELHRTPWDGRPIETSGDGSTEPVMARLHGSGTGQSRAALEPRSWCDTS
jgi:hypothetical protein